MIKLENVQKVYGKKNKFVALKNINLEVKEGDFLGIVGTSGSGKTTLLSILGMLDIPNDGSYYFDQKQCIGLSKSEVAKIRGDDIGFILQDFGLIEEFTVEENIMLGFDFSKENYSKKNVVYILQKLGIEKLLNKKVRDLSGGQKQRVAFVRAYAKNPKVILCDEPTGNLDSKNSGILIELLKEVNRLGVTVVVVTHDYEIESSCSRVIRLEDGMIVEDKCNEVK